MLLSPLATPHSSRVRLSIAETICESMAHATEDLDIAAVAVFTETGATARQLSKYRPKPPIFALSSSEQVINRMPLLWGVEPILCPKLTTTEQMVTIAEHLIEEAGYLRKGDILGIVAGTRTLTGSTNFLRLHVTGDQLPDTSTTSTPAREPVHA
jgi:pyruvate kinase